MIFDFPRDIQRFLLFVLPPETPSFTATVDDFMKQSAKAALHIDRRLELSG
jgi:hypothetical protein